uniref:Uncharacterized protein n=1 Tax=Zea mays TaxID=4577 RepID=B4FXN1_MAIZE|nr:unknown [Zea mays]
MRCCLGMMLLLECLHSLHYWGAEITQGLLFHANCNELLLPSDAICAPFYCFP